MSNPVVKKLWEIIDKSVPDNGAKVICDQNTIGIDLDIPLGQLGFSISAYSRSELRDGLKQFRGDERDAEIISPNGPRDITLDERKILKTGLQFMLQDFATAAQPTLESLRTLPKDAAGPTYIMCSPEKILDISDKPSVQFKLQSRKKWESLKRTIETLGGNVKVLDGAEPNNCGPSEIWVRDPVVVLERENAFLIPKLDRNIPGRRTIDEETRRMARKLEAMGMRRIDVNGAFDGGDVIVDAGRKIIFLGHSQSNQALAAMAAHSIEKQTDYRVIPITRDKSKGDYFHLDMGLMQLPKGEYILDSHMVHEPTRVRLKNLLRESLIVTNETSSSPYSKGTFNSIMVGDTLIMPHCPNDIKEQLQKRKYQIVQPSDAGMEDGSWLFKDGAARCVTLRTRDDALDMKYASYIAMRRQQDTGTIFRP